MLLFIFLIGAVGAYLLVGYLAAVWQQIPACNEDFEAFLPEGLKVLARPAPGTSPPRRAESNRFAAQRGILARSQVSAQILPLGTGEQK